MITDKLCVYYFRLIDLCLIYSKCHNSALNYNIYWLNSSKVKKKCINRNYYDLYVLSVKIHGFPIKSRNKRKDFRFGKNRVIMYSSCRGRSRISGWGGGLKKIAPSRGRPENIWGISCEKSQFYAKKSYFLQ
jgi:hypothetical protein